MRAELEQARSLLSAARGELLDRQQQLTQAQERARTCEAASVQSAERLRSLEQQLEEIKAELMAEKQRSDHAKVFEC